MVTGLRDITLLRGKKKSATGFQIGGLAGKQVVGSPERPSSFRKETRGDAQEKIEN